VGSEGLVLLPLLDKLGYGSFLADAALEHRVLTARSFSLRLQLKKLAVGLGLLALRSRQRARHGLCFLLGGELRALRLGGVRDRPILLLVRRNVRVFGRCDDVADTLVLCVHLARSEERRVGKG